MGAFPTPRASCRREDRETTNAETTYTRIASPIADPGRTDLSELIPTPQTNQFGCPVGG